MSKITSYFSSLLEFDPDAQIYFDAASITDSIEKPSVNVKVLALKAAGLWDGKVAIYPISPTSIEAASYNLKDPTKFQLTYINSPNFGPTGVDWDGLTQYARTGIIPSIDLTDNDVHLGYYSRDNIAENGAVIAAQNLTTQRLYALMKFVDGQFYFDCYNFSAGGRINGLNPSTLGLAVASRRSSTDVELYMNGVSLVTGTNGGGSSPTVDLFLAAHNNNGIGAGAYSQKECAFASVGLGLTDTDVTNLTNIVKVYQQTVIAGGRAVA